MVCIFEFLWFQSQEWTTKKAGYESRIPIRTSINSSVVIFVDRWEKAFNAGEVNRTSSLIITSQLWSLSANVMSIDNFHYQTNAVTAGKDRPDCFFVRPSQSSCCVKLGILLSTTKFTCHSHSQLSGKREILKWITARRSSDILTHTTSGTFLENDVRLVFI